MTQTALAPTVLPYHDRLRGRRGWQFALPARTPSGDPAPPDVLVLLEDGGVVRHRSPILTGPDPARGKPGAPQWGWVPTRVPDGLEDLVLGGTVGDVVFQRVRAPKGGVGRAPLVPNTVPERPFPRAGGGFAPQRGFVTPAGDAVLGGAARAAGLEFGPAPADLGHDVLLPDGAPAPGGPRAATVRLGATPFATVWVDGEYVLAFVPGEFCLRHGLWTTHVVAASMASVLPPRKS